LANPLLILPEQQLQRLRSSYERSVAVRRRQGTLGLFVLIALIAAAGYAGEVSLSKLWAHIGNFTGYFSRIVPELAFQTFATDLDEWMWNIGRWVQLIFDTVLIAYCGTILGFIGGFSLCFFATSNLMPSRAVRFSARRLLEFLRSVPDLVFALIFVYAFRLGPIPGVLAIALHSTGALGKLFTEAAENIDMQPVEGSRACGGGWLQTIRFAVLPQVLPTFASYTLLRFEINVRGSSVIGFVGAGGIGQDYLEAIRQFHYSDVSAILVLIVITVFIIDIATERLRHSLIGFETP
jgi:phosphonate transport system permease protein